jgi:alpha-tubulin suppressor-like RCC1 family protein
VEVDHVDNKDLWNEAVSDRLRPRRQAAAGVAAGLRIAGSAFAVVLTVTALSAAFSGPAFGAPLPPATTAATAGSVAIVDSVATAGPLAKHWGSFFGNTDGDVDTHWSPGTVHLPGQIAQIASSNSTQYALLTNGSVYAWGLGSQGELGDGWTGNSFHKPVRVRFPAGVEIAALPTDAMPYDTGLALDTRGRAWGWGSNAGGSLCLGTIRTYLRPAELPLRDVTTLAGASTHTLFDAGGTVYSCGANLSGDLGDRSPGGSTRPVKVAGLGGRAVVQLVASFANSGALLSDGSYYDWGYDRAGQLGDGRIGRDSNVPVRVRLPGPVRQVALGGSIWDNGQTLVLLQNDAVWAWGNDSAGQLGDQAERSEPSPIRIHPPRGVTYSSLATGATTSYAISATGRVYAWGLSDFGQIGDGSSATSFTPVWITSWAVAISATADNVDIDRRPKG